jgi:hypothetical protein
MTDATPDPWAAALLADDSDSVLEQFADYLEDQDDSACEGVREYIVKQGKRPHRYDNEATWWRLNAFRDLLNEPDDLEDEIFLQLRSGKFDEACGRCDFCDYKEKSWAESHLAALLDAARAYVAARAAEGKK